MSDFDASMAMADGAAFSEMGEDVVINAVPVRAIKQPNEVSSRAADGGFESAESVRFEVSLRDFIDHSFRIGHVVEAGAEKWRVSMVRRRGDSVDLVCIATSGRTGRAEF
jgi:hypothetical protein